MQFCRVCAFILIFLKYNLCLPLEKEPRCSKFAFEEQVLEKTIRQEINVEVMKNEMTKTQESVVNTLENLKATDVVVTQTLESLQRNFTDLAETNSLDKEKNEDSLKQTFDELRAKLTNEIEEQMKDVTQQKETLLKTFEELKNNFTNETKKQEKTITKHMDDMKKPSVAFFAHNVEHLKLDKKDKIIIFTTATTNEGSGYDTSTGIFTSPVGGLYQFIVNYCSLQKSHTPLALVMSGNVIARATNLDRNHYTCSAFSAVVRVDQREKIWVKNNGGGSSNELKHNSDTENSFSGVLIGR